MNKEYYHLTETFKECREFKNKLELLEENKEINLTELLKDISTNKTDEEITELLNKKLVIAMRENLKGKNLNKELWNPKNYNLDLRPINEYYGWLSVGNFIKSLSIEIPEKVANKEGINLLMLKDLSKALFK